jgi:hypothetical protein
MTFSATPKFIVATQRFSYPKSKIFLSFCTGHFYESLRKETHSDEVADAHQTATPTNTTPNARQRNPMTATKNRMQQQQRSSKFDK